MTGETRLRPASAGASLHATDPGALVRMSIEELDLLFADLDQVEIASLQGEFEGHVVALAGLDWLPGPTRRMLFERGPWQGQRLEGAFGTNTWLRLPTLEFARYVLRPAPAIEGEGTVLRLDYDVAPNPKPLRGLIGELRGLGPGSFLVRMYLRAGGRVTKLSYFTLQTCG